MTRKQIEREYNIKNGKITNQGKFQGESPITPYYHNEWLEGGGDTYDHDEYDGGTVTDFDVSDEDRAEFPVELKNVKTVRIWETTEGFVCIEKFLGCDSCSPTSINTYFVHEAGCPNDR